MQSLPLLAWLSDRHVNLTVLRSGAEISLGVGTGIRYFPDEMDRNSHLDPKRLHASTCWYLLQDNFRFDFCRAERYVLH